MAQSESSPPPKASLGAVQFTAVAAASSSSALIVVMWAVHPTWPPSIDVIAVVFGWVAPVAHLVGRGIYRRLEKWSGETA